MFVPTFVTPGKSMSWLDLQPRSGNSSVPEATAQWHLYWFLTHQPARGDDQTAAAARPMKERGHLGTFR